MKNRTFQKMTAIFPVIALALFSTFALIPKANAGEAWETDLAKAKVTAKASDKSMLLLFTGSDW